MTAVIDCIDRARRGRAFWQETSPYTIPYQRTIQSFYNGTAAATSTALDNAFKIVPKIQYCKVRLITSPPSVRVREMMRRMQLRRTSTETERGDGLESRFPFHCRKLHRCHIQHPDADGGGPPIRRRFRLKPKALKMISLETTSKYPEIPTSSWQSPVQYPFRISKGLFCRTAPEVSKLPTR